VLCFFVVLMTLDWLAFHVWGRWLEWWAVLALASVIPGLGLMITWHEV